MPGDATPEPIPEHATDGDATAESIEGRAGVHIYSVNISVASGVGLHWPRPWRLWPDWRDATVVAK